MRLERKDIGLVLVFITVIAIFLSNSLHYSTTQQGLGYGDIIRKPSDVKMTLFIFIGMMLAQYLGQLLYLVLAGAGIAFIAASSMARNFKLFLLVIFLNFSMVAYAQIQPFFIHGRYIDHLVPLMLIPAFYYTTKSNKYDLTIGCGASLISVVAFFMFWRDTVNAFSNLYIFVPIYALFILFVGAFVFLHGAKNNKNITLALFACLLITFSATNVLNYTYLKTASDNAYNHCTIGRYISDNHLKNIVMDVDDIQHWKIESGSWFSTYCLLNYYYGFRIPAEKADNITGQYFISSKRLAYPILCINQRFSTLEVEQTGELYLYKVF